ncbi:MAG: hypothetical protein ACI9UJ_001498 [bacterium]|jgi:hypothetical protein
MIGLILVFFAGKFYYDLAKEYGKSKWGFAFIGVVTYYGGQVIGVALTFVFMDFLSIDPNQRFLLSLLALPFGILSAFILYKILSKRLRTKHVTNREDVIDDIDLT